MSEQLVALCDRCLCCLANRGHCWTCHTTISIKDLCGDDVCEDKMSDYLSRQEIIRKRRLSTLGR